MTKNQIMLARIMFGFCLFALSIAIFKESPIAIVSIWFMAGIIAFLIAIVPDGVGGYVDKLVVMIFLVFSVFGFISLFILCLMEYQDHKFTINKLP